MKYTRYITTAGILYQADDNKIRIRKPFGSDEWLFEVFENGLWQGLSGFEKITAAKKAADAYRRNPKTYIQYL